VVFAERAAPQQHRVKIFRASLRLDSMVEQKHLRVQQRPDEVFPCGLLAFLLIGILVRFRYFRGLRGASLGGDESLADARLDWPCILREHYCAAAAIRQLLRNAFAVQQVQASCARLLSPERSHSQALLFSGRPQTVRK
jgi:hypothetical protein